jgi:hypothetical protein
MVIPRGGGTCTAADTARLMSLLMRKVFGDVADYQRRWRAAC